MWRYTSISDLLNIIKAASLSSLIVIAAILLSTRFIGFSRSVFIIDWFLTILLISGLRLSVRLFYERVSKAELTPSAFLTLMKSFSKRKENSKKLIIIGAGNSGEKICREIHNNPHLNYEIVGFLDDDVHKIGRAIHGIKILGTVAELPAAAAQTQADEILIAITSADGRQMRRIVSTCKDTGIPFKTVPGYGELINGKISVKSIRDVAYRDLLGREIVKMDAAGIESYLKDKTVLVTGAGGSIGSELCRQICRFNPRSILLFERAESPLYSIELELKNSFADIKVNPILGDILDIQQVDATFTHFSPQVVFHAAAYKHVPMLEIQPWKAVENNIKGTANLLDFSVRHHVERFVFVSTDKAVRPTNVMGASKRVAERLIQCQPNLNDVHTRFSIVRFGNVLGSIGSVVPLFRKQIEQGGPVTVTHPEVTRYFMTIPEACQLILQAGALGKDQVNIYVLDMGSPIKIVDMAKDLIRLSGFEPGRDIQIEFVGLRPGEKLYEELITEGEGIVPTSHKKIMALHGESCGLQQLNGTIEALLQSSKVQDDKRIKLLLKKIVKDYRPFNEDH
ncbi:nucleoside-diphosphate sugar epimerase/dehydratase [uncultured Desulfosarcina sp.]|uniref:polysaccharide biosynthesis protein n=1 Tax=uncultured Desulfosarcina sp. TaxID=218289 RepID=UPI0029C6C96B|nr:nucleoside-diphosphate sugar epimerase/dehydratase [uncultured Desulfosarcina sp.]